MTQNDMAAFAKIWGGMAEMYGKTVSDAVIAMCFNALQRFDLQDVRRAISAHVADPVRGQFIAKPADLILHIDGDPESRSLQAWSLVEDGIFRVGPYQTVVFDEPAVMAAIEDMGGWIDLCKVDEGELPFKRQEFVKRYKGYLTRPPTSHPAKLIGIAEAHNMQHAPSWKDVPRLIGNPERAKLVHQTGSAKSSNCALSFSISTFRAPISNLSDWAAVCSWAIVAFRAAISAM